MEGFIKGDIVVIPFPFSDLSTTKRRPALVLSEIKGEDVILCQITSQDISDDYAIPLLLDDYKEGSLNQVSNIRPNRLFTADQRLILYKAGQIKNEKYNEVVAELITLVKK